MSDVLRIELQLPVAPREARRRGIGPETCLLRLTANDSLEAQALERICRIVWGERQDRETCTITAAGGFDRASNVVRATNCGELVDDDRNTIRVAGADALYAVLSRWRAEELVVHLGLASELPTLPRRVLGLMAPGLAAELSLAGPGLTCLYSPDHRSVEVFGDRDRVVSALRSALSA